MNRDDRLRMLLHPERYTTQQLDQMLNEVRIETPDAEVEWQRFSRRTARRPWLKAAATVAGIMVLSGISFAAISHLSGASEQQPSSSTLVPDTVCAAKAKTIATPASKQQETVVFNNIELDSVMRYLSQTYGVQVLFDNDSTRHLRLYLQWDNSDSLANIVEKLNQFEKINMALTNQTIIVK